MTSTRVFIGLMTLVLCVVMLVARGATQTAARKGAPEAKAADVVKVQKKPFKIEIAVKGSLEPEAAAEIYFRAEPIPNFTADFAPLIIDKVVEHGSTVKKGDVLVAFDTRKLDLVIKDSHMDMHLLETSIRLAEDELPLAEKSMPVELAAAERGKKIADEDLGYFLEISRPQTERSAHFMVKQAAFYLENAREELRQLEKMYKSKDLTEETEQIILKRQRHQVEAAEFYFKDAKIDRDYVLKISLPRKEKDLKDKATLQELALEKARATLGPNLAQKKQNLAKLHVDRAKLKDRLEKLERDRERLVLRAPRDGMVYYGRLHKGQWTSATAMAGKLAPHAIAFADETLMTVVQPRPLSLRLAIDEKDVSLIKPGLEARVQVPARPDLKLKGKVATVSAVPTAPGQFEAMLKLDAADNDALAPGMACNVKFVPYSRAEAIAVPASAVIEEDEKHFVTVVHAGGKQERREVTTGKTSQDSIEILTGLREGEEILKDASGALQKR